MGTVKPVCYRQVCVLLKPLATAETPPTPRHIYSTNTPWCAGCLSETRQFSSLGQNPSNQPSAPTHEPRTATPPTPSNSSAEAPPTPAASRGHCRPCARLFRRCSSAGSQSCAQDCLHPPLHIALRHRGGALRAGQAGSAGADTARGRYAGFGTKGQAAVNPNLGPSPFDRSLP